MDFHFFSIFKIGKRNFFLKRLAGFSLIELMVAMAILTLIIGGITLFGIRTIQAHTRSQAMQNALENARFAIESINKMARTSQLTSVSANSITFTSNDANIGSVTYAFNDKKLNYSGTITNNSQVALVGDDKVTVNGSFFGWSDSLTGSDLKRGFVSVEITITYTYNSSGSPSEKDSIKIRSGVSTRY